MWAVGEFARLVKERYRRGVALMDTLSVRNPEKRDGSAYGVLKWRQFVVIDIVVSKFQEDVH